MFCVFIYIYLYIYIYLFTCFHIWQCVKTLVPLVNLKIAGKWMFIPLKMVLIGIDPYPYDDVWSSIWIRIATLRGSGRHTHDDWAHEDNASWKRFVSPVDLLIGLYVLDNMYSIILDLLICIRSTNWIICIRSTNIQIVVICIGYIYQ